MIILSITFHVEDHKILEWNSYYNQYLKYDIEKLNHRYIISEVINDFISEGKNINLLLFFENNDDKDFFLKNIFPSISEKIINNFKESIIIFKTILNPIDKRF